MTRSKNTGSEESVFLCSIIVDDVGEQADNGQYAENDFSCVHFFTPSTVREIFDGLDNQVDNQVDHRAYSLENRA